MIRRPPRSTQGVSSAASDVYKRQEFGLRLEHTNQKILLRLLLTQLVNQLDPGFAFSTLKQIIQEESGFLLCFGFCSGVAFIWIDFVCLHIKIPMYLSLIHI
eukprot:TRINITY_DN12501_c0_g1_i2.p2 TRINITY_DN12501_c0_g1~~TRINITY_DN12501_c0_g1_i2.p2  ORF type:complete len:102 (+),score=20.91 TRINITY_DN12501_c0_g1_i2:72-377(+)